VVRKIEIELEGVRVVATLLEDKAPKTSEAFWKILPLEADAKHCTLSGECVFFTHDKIPKVEPENHSPFVSQGDIVLSPDREIIIVHGRKCLLRTYTTIYHPSNHFAIIDHSENLEKFEKVAENLKNVGAKKIVFRRT
jgi:hypothetical protein